jgi:hypothetical protein
MRILRDLNEMTVSIYTNLFILISTIFVMLYFGNDVKIFYSEDFVFIDWANIIFLSITIVIN